MDQLDFATLQRIREAVAQIDTTDLVGVWSAAEGERLLFIYNAERTPDAAALPGQPITLKALADHDPSGFEGLLVGISALDLLPPHPLTKGPGFYPLERLLAESGQRPLLNHNLYRLAGALLDSIPDQPGDTIRRYQVQRKALQLALPYLIDEHGADELVAIMPGEDLGAFVADRRGRWLRADDDLRPLSKLGPEDWLIALEELAWLSAAVTPESGHFVSLRRSLLRSGQHEALKRTCRALAKQFIAHSDGSAAAHLAAYQLILETWLSDEDAEDLVAIFPHIDFARFAATGDRLRVYRSAHGFATDQADRASWSLATLLTTPIPAAYQSYAFALIPLDRISGLDMGRAQVADLGPILRQADHDAALAQTMLMLANDIVTHHSAGFVRIPPAVASELAQRAWIFISLGDPWLWRHGRYGQLLASAAAVLERTLSYQVQTDDPSVRDYRQALLQWYGCVGDDATVKDRLRAMGARLRSFQYGAGVSSPSSQALIKTVENLLAIEQGVFLEVAQTDQNKGASQGQTLAPDTRGFLRNQAASWQQPIPIPSPVFQRRWRELMQLRQERQREQQIERDVETLQTKFDSLRARLEALERRLYAPPQEIATLRFLTEREITEVTRHLEQLTKARLHIEVLNPYLEPNREITLECEAINTGRTKMLDVEMFLRPSISGFELLSTPDWSFPELTPHAPQRFTCRLRVFKADEVRFHFGYRHAESQGDEDIEIGAKVRGSDDRSPFHPFQNPFNTGDIITDPEQFYGREQEMERLLRHLASKGRTNFLLQGPRRMGKSSMLVMVEQVVRQPGLRRRFNIPADWDESLDAYTIVKLNAQGFNPQTDASHINSFFYALIDGVAERLIPERREQILNNFRSQLTISDPQRAAAKILNQMLIERPLARVLVLLDEYDELYKPILKDLDVPLRYVVQDVSALTWIIASTRLLVEHSRYYGSPWYNILNQVRLGCLPRTAARDLVIDSSQRVGVEWRGDAIVRLLDETGSHPFFLQLFCSQVIDDLNAKRQADVDAKMIADLIEETKAERTNLHSYLEPLWGGDISGVGQLIMLLTDENEEHLTKDRLREEVESYLQVNFGAQVNSHVSGIEREPRMWWERAWEDGLAEVVEIRNVLHYDRDTRSYRFAVPLFHRWLQQKGWSEDLRAIVNHKIKAELLKKDDIN